MTVHAKANPVGLDLALLRFQNSLNGIGWANIDVYGKLYIENDGKTKIAKAYLSSGEYKDVFVDDRKTAVFGFLVDGTREGLSIVKVPVTLICSCNLDSIYTTTERNDEEVICAVINALGRINRTSGQIKTEMQDVFSKFSWDRLNFKDVYPWFKFMDLHPWFNFSITFDLIYKNNY